MKDMCASAPRPAPGQIRLIVNADDFGLTTGVNHGIVQAHRRGIVTSTSLMVRRSAARDAARRAAAEPGLSVGLHFDLGEWVCRDGEWSVDLLAADPEDASAVEAEAARQLTTFEELTGRSPTHIDSHQHVHRSEPARSVLARVADALGMPLRAVTPGVAYTGDFFGQGRHGVKLPGLISVPALLKILDSLPPGVTELGCHPGFGRNIPSEYGVERETETRTLCDPYVQRRIAESGIALISFHDLQSGVAAA